MTSTKVVGGFFVALLSVVAIACGTNPDATSALEPSMGAPNAPSSNPSVTSGTPTVTAHGLPCDVDTILKTDCQTCHGATPSFGASVPLVTWDDLQAPAPGNAGRKLFDLVKERVHAETSPMPPSPNPRLTSEELSAIDDWVGNGALASTDSCSLPSTPAPAVDALPCKPDTSLRAATPFTMEANPPTDEYTCYGVDIDLTTKRHITALAPHVDNKDIVHHILLFQTQDAVSSTPFKCSAFGSAAWKLVSGWAPGANNFVLPPEAGFPEEEGTTHWAVQVHYNTTKVQTGTDASGYDFCTTEDLRPNDAGITGLGSVSFNIPPRTTKTIKCDYTLGTQFKDVTFFNAWPHMHTFGRSMSTERLAGGTGTPQKIFEQQAFSFEAQVNFPISQQVDTGDVMRTRCTWTNTSDDNVSWGENTGNEMCFNFIAYYPAAPDVTFGSVPIFTWTTPALNAVCTDDTTAPTPGN